MESTYDILTENCIEECKDVTKTPNDNAFEFWYTLISQLMIVLYQDHHIYPSCLARFALGLQLDLYNNAKIDIVLSILGMYPQKHTTACSVRHYRMS